jgi:hypothetical protein
VLQQQSSYLKASTVYLQTGPASVRASEAAFHCSAVAALSPCRVDAVTGIISTVVGTGKAGFSGDGGPATLAQLMNPVASAFDAAGNLYTADFGNWRCDHNNAWSQQRPAGSKVLCRNMLMMVLLCKKHLGVSCAQLCEALAAFAAHCQQSVVPQHASDGGTLLEAPCYDSPQPRLLLSALRLQDPSCGPLDWQHQHHGRCWQAWVQGRWRLGDSC